MAPHTVIELTVANHLDYLHKHIHIVSLHHICVDCRGTLKDCILEGVFSQEMRNVLISPQNQRVYKSIQVGMLESASNLEAKKLFFTTCNSQNFCFILTVNLENRNLKKSNAAEHTLGFSKNMLCLYSITQVFGCNCTTDALHFCCTHVELTSLIMLTMFPSDHFERDRNCVY